MTSEHIVTFLMPVYNGMQYIQEAIQSVLVQKGANWKLLIVDDGSTDGTWEYVQGLTDAQIHVERNSSNTGLYGTLNERVHQITSQWTVLIFQDDRLMPDYLESMLAITERHRACTLIWAAINIIDPCGKVTHAGLNTGREEPIASGVEAWKGVLLRGTIWTISGSFSRTLTLQKYGFRKDLPHLGDYDFLLRSIMEEDYVYYEHVLSEFREHSNQASSSNLSSGRDLEERLKVVSEQLSLDHHHIGIRFRLTIMSRLAKSVASRALGALRRGHWSLAYFCATRLPDVIRSCFPSAKITSQSMNE